MHKFIRPILRAHSNGRNNSLLVMMSWRRFEAARLMFADKACPPKLRDALDRMPQVKKVDSACFFKIFATDFGLSRAEV